MSFDELFNEQLKDYLGLIKEKEGLSCYEYLNLVALILNDYLLTKEEVSNDDINYFIMLIKSVHGQKIVNDNNAVFKASVAHIVKNYFQKYGINEDTYLKLMNNWFNGYLFHTLNASYAEHINENGLKIDDKPWDLAEVKGIMKLFDHSVFGLFNGENEGIFFAPNLSVSPYYGLTSPTFFRKFVENDHAYLNVFLNRDYPRAYESIQKLCLKNNLSKEDSEVVMAFFKKYWLIFTSDKLPSILMKKRDKTDVPPYPEGDVVSFVINSIGNDIRNTYYKKDIPRDELIIFSYDTLGITHTHQKTN